MQSHEPALMVDYKISLRNVQREHASRHIIENIRNGIRVPLPIYARIRALFSKAERQQIHARVMRDALDKIHPSLKILFLNLPDGMQSDILLFLNNVEMFYFCLLFISVEDFDIFKTACFLDKNRVSKYQDFFNPAIYTFESKRLLERAAIGWNAILSKSDNGALSSPKPLFWKILINKLGITKTLATFSFHMQEIFWHYSKCCIKCCQRSYGAGTLCWENYDMLLSSVPPSGHHAHVARNYFAKINILFAHYCASCFEKDLTVITEKKILKLLKYKAKSPRIKKLLDFPKYRHCKGYYYKPDLEQFLKKNKNPRRTKKQKIS